MNWFGWMEKPWTAFSFMDLGIALIVCGSALIAVSVLYYWTAAGIEVVLDFKRRRVASKRGGK